MCGYTPKMVSQGRRRNRPSTTMRPSAIKRPSATMVVLDHHVKTNDWKVSYMSGVEIHVLLRKEAQYKQIGPVPP